VKSLLLVLSAIRHPETRSFIKTALEGAGHRVIESEGYAQAESLLANGLDPDLLLIESTSGNPADKLQYLRLLKSSRDHSVCLVMGVADQRLRQEAAGLGIKQFLMRPVTRKDIESVVDELHGAVADSSWGDGCHATHQTAEAPTIPLVEELGENRYFLAASPAILEIHRQAKLIADVDVPVLILGESGTGKELVAHLIHKYSRRSRKDLLNVNCAALPAELLESELFGHQQGAFTGAIKDRAGRFEQANRGTLLLDEIGEISGQMQAKLLHVLQDGQFTRLGGQETTKVDVRILAATNVNMETALQEKSFREDLYYRLSAFTICVPPLRERREEIPYLIEETIRRAPAEMKVGSVTGFSQRLMDLAILHDWRGNVRELRNFVTRTMIMRDQHAAIRELESKIAARTPAAPKDRLEIVPAQCSGMRSIVRDIKDRTEVQMIQEALDASGWNRRHAAKNLNISYRALLYKIQQHRLTPRKAVRGMNDAFLDSYSARGKAV
jgi:two-component system, NtrC family, response regulator AtoC